MIVMKFGGSSLESPDAIDRVCGIIERSSTTPLVVVSAFGGTTDILTEAMLGDPGNGLALIRKLRQETISLTRNAVKSSHNDDAVEYVESRFEFIETQIRKLDPDSEDYAIMLDEIICCGELVSSYVMTQALLSRKQNAVFLDARNIMLTTNDRGAASALFEPTRKKLEKDVIPKLKAGRTVVLGGFIGSSMTTNVSTTLGRGGSDFSATFFGGAIGAEEVQIWTDVDGVMTTDPTLINTARNLPQLSFTEASELAYFGGRVLHPSTILPAIEHDVPVRVLNSSYPDLAGTVISNKAEESETVVKAIVYKEDITLIDIHSTRMLMASGYLSAIFDVFEKHKTPVDMVSTSEVSVSLTIDETESLKTILEELRVFTEVEAIPGKAIVCVVGEGIRYTQGIAAKVFKALEGVRIRMISLGASRVNIGFVVDEDELEKAVRQLHDTFFGEE